MSTVEIENMTHIERLQTMESLWDSLTHDDAEMASPDWHGNILEKRKQNLNSGDAQFLSLETVKDNHRK